MWNFLKQTPPTAIFGMLVILVTAILAVFAPLIAPYGETQIVGAEYLPWGDGYVLGTDNLGRDMLSRMIFGARNTVGLAILTTAIAFFIGSFLGIFVALKGGWIDQTVGRIVDVLMAVPPLILALILLAILGSSIPNMVAVIAVIYVAPVFRLARAAAMDIAELDFIQAAKLRGEGTLWLIRREILPNITSTLLAEFGLRFCFVFLFIAALSFLGLGVQPPTPSWGYMVATGIQFYQSWWMSFFPGLAIFLTVLALNFLGDAVRDAFDARLGDRND